VESYVLNLYEEFRSHSGFEFVYLCKTQTKNKKYGEIWQDNEKKNVYHINLQDGNVYSLIDFGLDEIFKNFLLLLDPDLIHFQHFIHFSLSWFGVAKEVLPKIKIIFTIHEFLAICPNSGQMIKTKWQQNQLCYKSGVSECSKCFPYIPRDIFEKRIYHVKKYFNFIDLFISPSQFLLKRYLAFGINKNKILYLENGHKIIKPKTKTRSTTLRLLYLGQINKFKGLHILLDSMKNLTNENIFLSIYGKFQDNEYENFIKRKISSLSNVKFYGQYEQNEVNNIFSKNDILVVPSVWWENSPVVIQESFIFKTPVLCSNIGGMKEKVNNGVNGIHFKSGSVADLTQKILYLYQNRQILEKLSQNIQPVKSIESNCQELVSIYRNFLTIS